MGKGSKARPLSIDYCSDKQLTQNWENTFGKKKSESKDSEAKDDDPVRTPECDTDQSGD